jgi:hypothetical protein
VFCLLVVVFCVLFFMLKLFFFPLIQLPLGLKLFYLTIRCLYLTPKLNEVLYWMIIRTHIIKFVGSVVIDYVLSLNEV